MPDEAKTTSPPSWWSAEGERDEAASLASRIDAFLFDARLVPPPLRDEATALKIKLRTYAHGE